MTMQENVDDNAKTINYPQKLRQTHAVMKSVDFLTPKIKSKLFDFILFIKTQPFHATASYWAHCITFVKIEPLDIKGFSIKS